MMINKLLRIAVRYGLIGGAIAFLLLLIMYYLGRHPLLVSPFIDFRILLFGIFIYFALREFRDYDQEGVLYFSQAMLGGFTVIFILSVVASALLLIFGTFVKGFVVEYVEQVIVYVKGFSEDDIKTIGKDVYDRNLAALPATNISTLAITYFIHGLVIGFFVNIILSAILRRQPKT
ncbi:MAG: DUF4199 domain-containing protein [Chryseolinea sp.]